MKVGTGAVAYFETPFSRSPSAVRGESSPSRGTLVPELNVVGAPFLVKVTCRSAVGLKLIPKAFGTWKNIEFDGGRSTK